MVNYTEAQKKAYYAAHPEKTRRAKPKAKATAKKKAAPRRIARTAYSSAGVFGPSLRSSFGNSFTKASLINYMSPFGKTEPPKSKESMGNFICYPAQSRFNISTSTTEALVCVFCPSIRGVYQTGIWTYTNGTAIVGSLNAGPLYNKFVESNDAPLNYKVLRSGIKLINQTSTLNCGGLVKVLMSASPLEFQFQTTAGNLGNLTVPCVQEFTNYVNNQPSTKEYSGSSFRDKESLFVIGPATHSAYNSYGGLFMSSPALKGQQAQFETQMGDMSMCHLMIVFDKTDVVNNYTITFNTQSALRFPLNTLASELQKPAKPPSSGDSDFLDNVHVALSENGSQKAKGD